MESEGVEVEVVEEEEEEGGPAAEVSREPWETGEGATLSGLVCMAGEVGEVGEEEGEGEEVG